MNVRHSRPGIFLKYFAHLLDESADMAAATLSGQLSGCFRFEGFPIGRLRTV